MAVNKTLRFVRKTSDHVNECHICGRKRLGRNAVAASFHPNDPPLYAAVYCKPCIEGLYETLPGPFAGMTAE